MIKDYIRIVILNFSQRKLRTWLTMIGVFLGVALFVSLISLGQGLQNAINEQFDIMGLDKVFVQPASAFGMPGTSTLVFSEKEKQIIGRQKGVEKFAAWSYKIGRIEFGDYLLYTWLFGFPLNEEKRLIEEFGDYGVEYGRWVKKGDKYKANIGWDFANVPNILGPKTLKIGDKVTIENKEFDIVGIMKRVGNSQDDRTIIVPMATYEELYGVKEAYDMVVVKVKSGVDPSKVADEIKRDLRKERDDEEGEESFTVQTSENYRDTFNDIFSIVNYFVAGLAFISLLVGGVGITNTMYTTVLERTREIGIMKAIGARNSNILSLFLIESGFIGMIGGIIGIIIGYTVSKLVEFVIKTGFGFELLSVKFNFELMIFVLIFSTIFGALAGALPARQASKQNPADALRS